MDSKLIRQRIKIGLCPIKINATFPFPKKYKGMLERYVYCTTTTHTDASWRRHSKWKAYQGNRWDKCDPVSFDSPNIRFFKKYTSVQSPKPFSTDMLDSRKRSFPCMVKELLILDKVQRQLQAESKKRAQERYASTGEFQVYLREPTFPMSYGEIQKEANKKSLSKQP